MTTDPTAELLTGMKAITTFVKSIGLPAKDDTVLGYIRDSEMPARKLGGIWIGSRTKILNWALEYSGRKEDKPETKPDEKTAPVRPPASMPAAVDKKGKSNGKKKK
jgi:hypothetical protein